MSARGLHRIEDELDGSWLETWVESGLEELAQYLAKHAAFLTYLETAEQH